KDRPDPTTPCTDQTGWPLVQTNRPSHHYRPTSIAARTNIIMALTFPYPILRTLDLEEFTSLITNVVTAHGGASLLDPRNEIEDLEIHRELVVHINILIRETLGLWVRSWFGMSMDEDFTLPSSISFLEKIQKSKAKAPMNKDPKDKKPDQDANTYIGPAANHNPGPDRTVWPASI
ncbi:hypothetical protein BCR39DRAFT_572524, partial [Naematelia encephala]